ncbi:PerC family transcriptional regulator [Escherichia coli]|nr:PerC family transcriptional regulator [Escherichia coli]
MIKDDKAEKLESMGLYRRAAVRWTDIMLRAKNDTERNHAFLRRQKCMYKLTSQSGKQESRIGVNDINKAIKRTYKKWESLPINMHLVIIINNIPSKIKPAFITPVGVYRMLLYLQFSGKKNKEELRGGLKVQNNILHKKY